MKILVISSYYTSPPRSGGQLRIFHLSKNVSKKHDVIQVSFTPAFVKPKIVKLENHGEIIIPKLSYMGFAFFVSRVFRMPFDFIIPLAFRFVREKKLEKLIKDADVVQIEHPWLFPFVYKIAKKYNKKIILDEHNAEFVLQESLFKLPRFLKKILVKYIKRLEGFAVKKADIVLTTSEDDKNILIEEFKIKQDKVFVVENGVDFKLFNERNDYAKLKKKIKSKYKSIILFSGSKHPPNYKAMEIIEKKISKKMPKYLFLIAGSLHKKDKQGNIIYTGPVNNIIPYFHISDVAINPLTQGSGTNLKMLEYLAASLPVVTTKIGARGFDLRDNEDCIISELKDFDKSIKKTIADKGLYKKLIKNGEEFAKNYDWSRSSVDLDKIYTNIA